MSQSISKTIETHQITYTALWPLAIGADESPNKGDLSLACP